MVLRTRVPARRVRNPGVAPTHARRVPEGSAETEPGYFTIEFEPASRTLHEVGVETRKRCEEETPWAPKPYPTKIEVVPSYGQGQRWRKWVMCTCAELNPRDTLARHGGIRAEGEEPTPIETPEQCRARQ